jgi:hypothetical protein
MTGQEDKQKVTDLTVEQFTFLIEDIIDRKLEEYFGDPDEGLELRPEFVKKLKAKTISMEQVCKEFGIKLEEKPHAHHTKS